MAAGVFRDGCDSARMVKLERSFEVTADGIERKHARERREHGGSRARSYFERKGGAGPHRQTMNASSYDRGTKVPEKRETPLWTVLGSSPKLWT